MTPAIQFLKINKIPHNLLSYQADDHQDGYGIAAAKALNQNPAQVFKTLIVAQDQPSGPLAVAMVPVSGTLSLKLAAQALGWKKAVMADRQKAQKSTGYVLGGISPLGQKTRLPILIDQSAMKFSQLFVSAGKRGLEVGLHPETFIQYLNAKAVPLAIFSP